MAELNLSPAKGKDNFHRKLISHYPLYLQPGRLAASGVQNGAFNFSLTE